MIIKQFFARVLRIPRRLRKYFYICWNRFVFWLNDVHFGKNMRVYNKFYLNKEKGSKLYIGDNFVFSSGEAFNSLCRNIRGCIYLQLPESAIEIGNDTGIAASAPIVIEDDVLIGTRCIILKGVTIGARSIIAAGSVVTKSIPADCIAGSNPCKVIKQLD